VVGFIPNPAACNPSGITFDAHGDLYVADAASGGVVWRLNPDAAVPPTATAFATGVPGTNGLAFDRDGNLWTGDGTSGQGRVWRIGSTGGACEPAFTGCTEAFRIQPMANTAGVGRSNGTLQPGNPAPSAQPLVANGVAFTRSGDLYVADTARGAVWRVELDRDGNLKSRTGCDTTFTANTLCLENIFVAHPSLEGTDGIALDRAGNIWNSANERNAIVVVTKDGRVMEIFRNPVVSGLRNAGPLELPTSPVLMGKKFCTANSDGNRRDNSPNSAGEVFQGGPVGARGKISCMDQELEIPGARLPVR
jgi:sugar lactone lactonase YvrE